MPTGNGAAIRPDHACSCCSFALASAHAVGQAIGRPAVRHFDMQMSTGAPGEFFSHKAATFQSRIIRFAEKREVPRVRAKCNEDTQVRAQIWVDARVPRPVVTAVCPAIYRPLYLTMPRARLRTAVWPDPRLESS